MAFAMDEALEKLVAGDVARGVARLFLRHELMSIAEVPLGNGRRADLFALCPKGLVTIVEIKVSKADLLGDGKWPEYLDYCDRYFWAVPQGFDHAPLGQPAFLPERTGIIVADRYDAMIVREAHSVPLAAPARRRETLAFARRAARRLALTLDPDAEAGLIEG